MGMNNNVNNTANGYGVGNINIGYGQPTGIQLVQEKKSDDLFDFGSE